LILMKTLVLTLLLVLSASGLTAQSAEEEFFSRFLNAARRGDHAAFCTLVSPDWLAQGTTTHAGFADVLRSWSRGIIHAEILSMTVLSDGSVRLSCLLTRKTDHGAVKEPLVLEVSPDASGALRLIRSVPRIIP